MKLAQSILCGTAALGLMAGSAVAMDESTSSTDAYVIAAPLFDGQVAWNDSPTSAGVTAYDIYGVDDDMDGRPDRYLIIEQSDTLAAPGSDTDLDSPNRG